MRFLLGLILILVLAAGGAWLVAGRMAAPGIQITKPEKFVGASTEVEVAVESPDGQLSDLQIAFEQNDKQVPLFSLAAPGSAKTKQDGQRVIVTAVIDKRTVPSLQSGSARISVRSGRKVLYGLRTRDAAVTRDVQVRLERPRAAVVSTHHYVNHGGAEMVVYRVTPDDVESGVVVGNVEYPGYRAAGATVDGVNIADPALRIAYFALLYDQDLNTPMRVYARDPAGNTARADFEHRVFPKPFKKSQIPVDDKFLDRVVPAILEGTTDIKPEGDTLARFLAINGELRRKNADKIASFAAQTAPEMLWRGVVFHTFKNNAVESAFADQRTYFYKGKEVDKQVHLGFDLASLSNAPVLAANRGKVLFADELGIYGNCVIIDHGMGIQSLYAHLSSIDVQPGQMVEKERTLGRSGMTGLAGGDHLHFTMLVGGQQVTPVDWWSAQWMQDRVRRKIMAAGGV